MTSGKCRIHCDSLEFLATKLEEPIDAIMLFGSHARGDANDESDIDVLQLLPNHRPAYRSGIVNVATYDKETLSNMARTGSLFVLHLVKEGRILLDKKGELRRCLSLYRPPSSYEQTYSEMRTLVNLLDVSEEQYAMVWRQVNETALFILRTCLFADYAANGRPTFSLMTIAKDRNDDQLLRLAALKRSMEPDWEAFAFWRDRIANTLRCEVINVYQSVEALIVNCFDKYPSVLRFGLRIVAKEDIQPSYGFAEI